MDTLVGHPGLWPVLWWPDCRWDHGQQPGGGQCLRSVAMVLSLQLLSVSQLEYCHHAYQAPDNYQGCQFAGKWLAPCDQWWCHQWPVASWTKDLELAFEILLKCRLYHCYLSKMWNLVSLTFLVWITITGNNGEIKIGKHRLKLTLHQSSIMATAWIECPICTTKYFWNVSLLF